jgi:hypothetical protein
MVTPLGLHTLALIMKALSMVLNEMQDEIGRGGWKF